MELAKVEKIVVLATALIGLAMKLGSAVTDIVQQAKNISPEDREAMIAKIKKAQSDVPEWT